MAQFVPTFRFLSENVLVLVLFLPKLKTFEVFDLISCSVLFDPFWPFLYGFYHYRDLKSIFYDLFFKVMISI